MTVKKARAISISKWLDVRGELKHSLKLTVQSAQKYGSDQKWICEQREKMLSRFKLTNYARAELNGFFDGLRDQIIKTQFAYKINGKLYGTIKPNRLDKKESFFPYYRTLGLSEKQFYELSKESGTYYESGKPYHDNSTFNGS